MREISTTHTLPAEFRALDMLRRAYGEKGYVFFSDRKYDLNIGGIRSDTIEPNRFDDSFFVAFIDGRSTWRVAMWSCTTDPGLNCHKAYSWNEGRMIGKNKVVANWSAGCQVAEVS